MKRGGLWSSVFCVFVMVPFVWATTVLAAELRVPSQYASIQAAIDAAVPGVDVVLVEPGTYSGNLVVQKAVTIRSEKGPEETTIDCGGTGRGFTFTGAGTSGAELSGFTITGGNAESGGAILCEGNASPTISDCILSVNQATNGGAIACLQSSPIISHCVMEGNNASLGGGLFVKNARASEPSPTLVGCTIASNTASGNGGGIYLKNYASPSFCNCLIAGNSAALYGGAFYFFNQCAPDIIHCTVTDNTSGFHGSGIFCNLSLDPYHHPVVTNSIIWGNVVTSATAISKAEIYLNNSLLDITYSAFDPGVENSNVLVNGPTDSLSEDGNIYEDPALVGEGDYRLSPDSPCIDKGTDQIELPEFDIDDNPRVGGLAPDMGAYEFTVKEPEVLQVEIDIKPGCPHNKINLKSWGVLAVAVKTTEEFDARSIDPSSVVFAGATPVWWIGFDIDRDRDRDMLFFFRVWSLKDLNENSTEATLSGVTSDGKSFAGTDHVTIIKPKGKAKGWHFGRR